MAAMRQPLGQRGGFGQEQTGVDGLPVVPGEQGLRIAPAQQRQRARHHRTASPEPQRR